MDMVRTRRGFLATASAAGVLGVPPALADEGPPETTTIRLPHDPNICLAPAYIAEDLLRAEGFTDIRYVPGNPGDPDAIARGEIDFDLLSATGWPLTWMPASRSRCWRVCMPAATSCSRTSRSAPSAT